MSNSQHEHRSEPDASGTAAPVPNSPPGYFVQYARDAMACEFAIQVQAGKYPQAANAALSALDVVEQVEERITVYRDASEVMDVNRRAAREAVAVSNELFALLELCARLHEETQGAFDATAGPLIRAWGFYRRQGRVPDEAALAAAVDCVGMQHVRLDAKQRSVRFAREGVELNFGSVGKGFALDRAAEVLVAQDVDGFLMHGGKSSVLARGSSGVDGWDVGIRDPLRPGRSLGRVCLRGRALATSGSGAQYFRHGGKRYGHILDPRTGRPAEELISTSVVAPSAAEADALATAFYVMGRDAAIAHCAERPHLAAVLVRAGGGAGGMTVDAVGFTAGDFAPASGIDVEDVELPAES